MCDRAGLDTPGEQGDLSEPGTASGAPVLLGRWEPWEGAKVCGAKSEGKGTGESTGDMGQGRDQRPRARPKEAARSLA